MNFTSKKPLIKQQTMYSEEEQPKSKMSLSTKRVSFNSTTTIQSDSDEENSLGRSNRRPLKKPNAEDDDLLNMFRNERSESDEDLQTGLEVKRKDKPRPVPRHSRSGREKKDNDISLTESMTLKDCTVDPLEQTINPKAKPRPQPRKMTEDSHSEEGSPRTLKPEVTPRKSHSKGRTTRTVHKNESEYNERKELDLDGFRRKTRELKNELSYSDGEDIIDDSERTKNKSSKVGSEFETDYGIKMGPSKMRKGSYEENGYDDGRSQHIEEQDRKGFSSILKRQEESSSQEKLNKGKYKLPGEDNIINSNKEAISFQGELMLVKNNSQKIREEEDINQEKTKRGIIPAPRPRKFPQDGLHEHESKREPENDSDNFMDSNNEVKKKYKKTPVPKARKEHLKEVKEKEIVSESVFSKSRLHPLDDSGEDEDDDDDDDKTKVNISGKRDQIHYGNKDVSREDEVDGKAKKEKTLDWSSLDESDDDDEAVGKKVSLFKKHKPTSAKATDNNNKEMNKATKPKPSPRHKPLKETESVEHKKRNTYENLRNSDYDSYQRVPRERGAKERVQPSIPSRTIPTPQRPGSSKKRNDVGWGSADKDVTDMFEEHIPDTSDVIGEDDGQWRHRKDQTRPRSSYTPKRGPMKADRGIEEMTRSPQLRQALTYDSEEWDYTPQKSLGRQKSSSLTNLNRTGGSDYRNYYDEDDGPRRNSLDTETIRQTVYDNWLSRKNVTVKKELSKKALQKQKEEEKRKEEEERVRSAQLAFKSWNERKASALKEQHFKMKAKQKEEQEKLELERQMKEKDSKKYFESWKNKKDEIIKETHKEKKKEITTKMKKEEQDKLEKTIASKKSFENWKSKKDTILKQQLKENKKKKKVEESMKEDESYEKTIKNADEFQKWVEKKGKPRRTPPPPTLSQRAWVPGSRHTGDCIPSVVQPVILPPSSNRARTMSGTYRGKTKYYDF